MGHPTLMGHAALRHLRQDLNSVQLTKKHQPAAQTLLDGHAAKLNSRAWGQDSRAAQEIIQEDLRVPYGAKPGAAWQGHADPEEAKPRADPMQTHRSCEEQETSPARLCQMHSTIRSSKCPKGVPLLFSAHFNSNTQLLPFFLFTTLSPVSSLVLTPSLD